MDSPEGRKPTQSIEAKEGSTIQNVIQAIIHLPAWAWVIGIVLLSISLLMVAAIFNVSSLQPLLPTPIAFAPAKEGQSLIIVADFEDRGGGKYKGLDPAQYIYEQVVAQAQKDNLDLRIERLRQVVDDRSARATGETYNATMIVWGWYDALTITPRIERIKTLEGDISDQEGRRLNIADPAKVEFSIVTDLPSQTAYLVVFTLAMDEYAKENFDRALVYLNNAIASVPSDSQTSTNPSEAYFFRAKVYYEKGDNHRAIADYTRAIEFNSEYTAAYNNRGANYREIGDYDRAIADYNKAIELDPEFAIAYNNRGIALSAKGDYDRAIADYNKAIELDPEFASPYMNRGITLSAKGDYDRAISDYNKAIELEPELVKAYNNRGNAYRRIGDYDRAIADYNKAIELDPEYSLAYNGRGLAYSDKGDYDRAIAEYNKAIELNPRYSDAYFNRGMAFSNKGEYERAIADYSKVIEINPEDAEAYYLRGFAYEDLGNTENAIIDFAKVLGISVDLELRQQAAEELKKLLKGQ